MRCSISNPKKLKKLSERTGLNVTGALVRGNTGHRIDLILNGKGYHTPHEDPCLWPDGSMTIFSWESGKHEPFITLSQKKIEDSEQCADSEHQKKTN